MQFNNDSKQETQQKNDPQLKQRLEMLIQAAIRKLGVKKENDLCRYLPVPTGGYIHHFTMKKMKYQNPNQLIDMLEKYIVQVNSTPALVAPKPRAARGSRKGNGITFSKQDLEKMLNMARLTGDKEMIRKLTRKTKDKKTVIKELIASIRQGRIESELWNNYVEVIHAQNPNYAGSQSQSSTVQTAAG